MNNSQNPSLRERRANPCFLPGVMWFLWLFLSDKQGWSVCVGKILCAQERLNKRDVKGRRVEMGSWPPALTTPPENYQELSPPPQNPLENPFKTPDPDPQLMDRHRNGRIVWKSLQIQDPAAPELPQLLWEGIGSQKNRGAEKPNRICPLD